jgi:hypothetical protein
LNWRRDIYEAVFNLLVFSAEARAQSPADPAFGKLIRKSASMINTFACRPPREAPLRARQGNWLRFAKKSRRWFLALLLWRLPKTHTWTATVLVDELDASRF